MIGQEGSIDQLETYIMNKKPATTEQIRKTTAPIREAIANVKEKATGVIDDIKKGTLTLFTIVVVGALFYVIATNKDK